MKSPTVGTFRRLDRTFEFRFRPILPFVGRASVRDVLGLPLPVASLEDVLQGKVWAASDPKRASKRRKDLLDIERSIEVYPSLQAELPPEISDRLARL